MIARLLRVLLGQRARTSRRNSRFAVPRTVAASSSRCPGSDPWAWPAPPASSFPDLLTDLYASLDA